MSDELKPGEMPAEQEPTQAVEPAVEAEEFDKERALETIKKLREFEKESKRLAKKVSEFEAAEQKRKEAEMSETDRLKLQLEKATKDLQTYQINELKRQAAAKYSLPDALVSRLQGDTLEDLERDAEELAKTLPKPQERQRIGPTNPGAVPTQSREQELKATLFGQQRRIFDPDYVRQHGGGVFEVTNNED